MCDIYNPYMGIRSAVARVKALAYSVQVACCAAPGTMRDADTTVVSTSRTVRRGHCCNSAPMQLHCMGARGQVLFQRAAVARCLAACFSC